MAISPKILAVDDEEFNLDILTDLLGGAGFSVVCAEDGEAAIARLEQHPDIEAIVLDRMMPRMDGIAMLHQIKRHEQWRHIPVIMQTAAAGNKQIQEGIEAGAYYYLAKPYDETLLLTIVRSALQDRLRRQQMQEEILKQRKAAGLIQRARFHFRTLKDVDILARFIADCFPKPDEALYGLTELMVNAIEHGNLGISYELKGELMQKGQVSAEIERRLNLSDYMDKIASLDFEATPAQLVVIITDQGAGFDWRHYLDFSPTRAMDPNGRGIALARLRSFPDMEYIGKGNQVVCRVPNVTPA